MVKEKQSIAKEYQLLLYGLFQTKLFNLEGIKQEDSNGMPEEYIAKSVLLDNSIEILNEVGKLMDQDERINNESNGG